MRIGVISDLHIDQGDYTEKIRSIYVRELVHLSKQNQLAHLIIARDISNHYTTTLSFMKQINEENSCPVSFVAGNHDYWDIEGKGKDTIFHAQQLNSSPYCLQNRPFLLNEDWAIIGHSGWYDYSFGNNFVTERQFQKKKYQDRTWKDHLYIDWKKSDEDMVTLSIQELNDDLTKVEGRNVIAAFHMVTTEKFIVPTPHPMFDYFNAFLGSVSYQELINQHLNIRYIINGHVHYRKRFIKEGKIYICACLGNKNEWRTQSLEKELATSLQVIEIE